MHQEIDFVFIYTYILQCVIVVSGIIIKNFAIQVTFTITPKVCTPKFESHKICKDFWPNNKDDFFSAHNENSSIAFAVGPWHVCGYEM